MEAKKKTTTKRYAMTSEEAARSLNLEHDLYLALLTEETRKNYESAGLFDDFFDNLTAEQKFDLIDDRSFDLQASGAFKCAVGSGHAFGHHLGVQLERMPFNFKRMIGMRLKRAFQIGLAQIAPRADRV